jgi:hypothetical protein
MKIRSLAEHLARREDTAPSETQPKGFATEKPYNPNSDLSRFLATKTDDIPIPKPRVGQGRWQRFMHSVSHGDSFICTRNEHSSLRRAAKDRGFMTVWRVSNIENPDLGRVWFTKIEEE